ncbi:hypothetical protein ACOMHN_043436 [Nucella lapillus]
MLPYHAMPHYSTPHHNNREHTVCKQPPNPFPCPAGSSSDSGSNGALIGGVVGGLIGSVAIVIVIVNNKKKLKAGSFEDPELTPEMLYGSRQNTTMKVTALEIPLPPGVVMPNDVPRPKSSASSSKSRPSTSLTRPSSSARVSPISRIGGQEEDLWASRTTMKSSSVLSTRMLTVSPMSRIDSYVLFFFLVMLEKVD